MALWPLNGNSLRRLEQFVNDGDNGWLELKAQTCERCKGHGDQIAKGEERHFVEEKRESRQVGRSGVENRTRQDRGPRTPRPPELSLLHRTGRVLVSCPGGNLEKTISRTNSKKVILLIRKKRKDA